MVRDSAMGNFARLEILPGPHRIGVSMNRVQPGGAVRSKGYLIVCAELEAGHTYETRPVEKGRLFYPEVVDVTTGKMVDRPCRARRPSPAPAGPVVAAAASAPAAAGDGSTAAGDEHPAPEATPPLLGYKAPGGLPVAPAPAVDWPVVARTSGRQQPCDDRLLRPL